QPAVALYGCAGSSVSSCTGGLPAALVCGNCSRSASSTLRPSSTSLSTSVVTVTRGAADAPSLVTADVIAGAAPGTLACGTLPAIGVARSASSATGTAGWVAATAAGSGAAFSRPHSIHSSTATISQAKIRNTRVWFISRQAQLSRKVLPARSK